MIGWVWSSYTYPGAPVSASAMYRERGEDMTYYPMVAGLANNGLHESLVKETTGSEISSFPIASLGIHALCLRFFGAYGFIIADLFFALLFYCTLVLVLLTFSVPSFAACATSLLVTTTSLNKIGGLVNVIEERLGHDYKLIPTLALLGFIAWQAFSRKKQSRLPWIGIAFVLLSVLLSRYISWYWSWHFPRPFVTEAYYLICLTLLFSFIIKPETFKSPRFWIFLGISESLLLQGAVHQAITVALLALLILTYLCKTYWNQITAIIKNACFAALSFAVVAIPFLYQRLHEMSDVPRRFGVFNVNRLKPLAFFPENYEWAMLIALILVGYYIFKTTADQIKKTGLFFLFALLLASLLSLPFSCIFLGKVVQIGHFWNNYMATLAFVQLCLILYVFKNENISATDQKPKSATLFLVVACALVGSFRDAQKSAQFTTPVRRDITEWSSLPSYRTDFNALVQELEKSNYTAVDVLGSFDVQLLSWWKTFHHGHVFNPDVFASVIPDQEVESRLIQMAKLIGMNKEQFLSFLERRYVSLFFLGQCKYQASLAHTFAPMNDYTPDQQKEIQDSTSIFSTFTIIIPKSEKLRLGTAFDLEIPEPNKRSLDLVVLTNDESLISFIPDPKVFKEIYKNASFRAYAK